MEEAVFRKIFRKLLRAFVPEKMPDFAALMYVNFARDATRMSFYKEIAGEIARRIEERGNTRNLLDIGTGPGFLLFEITKLRPDLTLVGADLSEKLLKFADEEKLRQCCPHIFFMKCDANRLDFSDNECDFVVSSGLLHLLKDPAGAIKEWLRILRPGGDLWIYIPSASAVRKNSKQVKNRVDEAIKQLSLKDRMFFRVMRWYCSIFPRPMDLSLIEEIIKSANIPYLISIKDRGGYIKIAIMKTTIFKIIE